MAATSPVLINTSPNVNSPFRIPSVTPTSLQRQAQAISIDSSSPSLLSPSAFVRPRIPTLKSGSHAQKVPDGAAQGFASAAALWKSNHFQEMTEAPEYPVQEIKTKVPAKRAKKATKQSSERVENGSDGKLVRPKKKRETTKKDSTAAKSKKVAESETSQYFGRDQDSNAAKDTAEGGQPETAGFDISEYTFAAQEGHQHVETEAAQKPLPNKARRRAVKTKAAQPGETAKRPKKRKAKSASFIVNSDDDGPDQQDKVQITAVAEPLVVDVATRPVEPIIASAALKPETENARNVVADASERMSQPALETPTKSDYFANHATAVGDNSEVSGPKTALDKYIHSPSHGMIPPVSNAIASKRRLSWTPAKDNIPVDLTETPLTKPAASPELPARQLSDILGGFGYQAAHGERASIATESSGQASRPTKRRRIELADPATAAPGARQQQQPTPVVEKAVQAKPAKRPKQPKKAQTITALATAAFQPAKAPSPAKDKDTDVSQFFATTKANDSARTKDNQTSDPPAKAKKPRKSRKSTTAADTPNGEASNTKKPKASKAKKPKARFKEADYLPKLHSPATATANMMKQDFLFGTSSQLAVDESPTFIRDMQAAVKESESVRQPLASDVSASQQPVTQVAASPKWKSCVRVPTAPHGTCLSVEQAYKELWCESSRDFKGGIFRNYGRIRGPPIPEMRQPARPVPEERVDETVEERKTFVATQIDQTRTAQTPEDPQEAIDTQRQEASVPSQNPDEAGTNDDTWMQLKSDGDIVETTGVITTHADHSHLSAPSVQMPAASSTRVPSPLRSPLRQLDRNVQVLNNVLPAEKAPALSGARLFSTSNVQSKSSPAKKRGRPPKATESPATSPAKRRGRSPKQKVSGSIQPEWLDIDDIDDPEAPVTPSPPRRRSTSVPPIATPLQFSPEPRATESMAIAAPALAMTASLKSTDAQWLEMRTEVFTKITRTIKQRSDTGKLTWWQKILLYDPIVLEDLTAWLNEQGLKIGIRKQRPKKKGRKRKDGAVADEGEEGWEVVEEPLQAWMVQKWCEEKSVCCLWEGGMRGGVRVRY